MQLKVIDLLVKEEGGQLWKFQESQNELPGKGIAIVYSKNSQSKTSSKE